MPSVKSSAATLGSFSQSTTTHTLESELLPLEAQREEFSEKCQKTLGGGKTASVHVWTVGATKGKRNQMFWRLTNSITEIDE